MTDTVKVPREPTEAMLMAARGLIMAREMRVPSSGYSLGKVATSGYYGDLWGHILTDDERAIEAPLTKAHLAQLIYRAMLAASPQGEGSSADAEPVPRYEPHPTGSGGSTDVLTYRVTEGVKP